MVNGRTRTVTEMEDAPSMAAMFGRIRFRKPWDCKNELLNYFGVVVLREGCSLVTEKKFNAAVCFDGVLLILSLVW